MMQKLKSFGWTAVLALAIVFVAGPVYSGDLKEVGLIVPGPIGDRAWNAAGHQALMKVSKKHGFQASYQENVSLGCVEAVCGRGV